nr:uncharacterized protein LOC103348895 isoform X1 [Oryctolagus cuniculus]
MEEEGMFSSAEESSQPSGGHPEVHGTSVDICSPVPETQDEKAVSPAGAEDTVLIRGPVTLKRGWRRKKHQVFLYSNVLLVSNSKYKKTIDVKYEIPLSSLWMADCGTETQGAGDTCAKRSFLLGWPMVNFVATFDSSVVKERWYSFLQRYINLAKEEDHTQSILIQVFTEDIKNCACSIIITVTNLDTVNDVVNVSLPMLGLTGSEKDYQLWVSSGKKEVPQPLIGHENPYAIQTSYLRAVRLPPEPGKSTFPSGLQESVLEELQSEVHGCFILKPRLQARAQRRTDWLRNLLFRWGIIRSQDDPPPEPAAAAPLSGPACAASLMALSEDDNLASPLSDMLSFIHERGPQTEGIFRKPGSVTSYRALKEKINAGDTVDWDSESALVAATVLQDFLRTIPGTVFSANLYDQWLDVLEEENEEKVPAIQRLLNQLPKANFILLRGLFASLDKIAQHSSFSPMAASDLSLCIAPRILSLWRSTSRSSELEEELRKKISLIHFLIQNYLEIFEDETTSIWRVSSLSSHNSFGESALSVSNLGESKDSLETTEHSLECQPVDMTTFKTKEGLMGDSKSMLDPHVKPTQRGHSRRKWLFWQGHYRRLDNLTQEPAQPTPQPVQLFGSLIQDVCENDNLPKTLVDMLFLIDQKGPRTEGIFRKRGNWKSCVALKEKLNSGHQVDWKRQSAFVVATTLMDFLQNIPASLFTGSLYDNWLHVLDEGDEEAKIAAIRRLLNLLPKPNVNLLRSLFGSLFKIAQHSSSFQKTSFDLSLCIAASLLWPPIPNSAERNTEWQRKVGLVQFLIEHCFRIFGKDVTSPIRENAAHQDNCQGASDPHVQPAQRRRPLRKWLFQRGPSRSWEDPPQEPALPVTQPVQLFGSLIQDVCENDNLPKPLVDMLLCIEQKGLHTEGIFKKCGNGKSCRALKDKLNSGHQVDWENESAVVVATTLKDFLQNIPASLFTGYLYDNWLHVLDEGSEKAKIVAIQRLLDELPKPNVNLLRSLFGLLDKIAQNSSSNHMTTSDLSFCIAPSLFWLPNYSNSAQRVERKKKIAVVKFLIEHFCRIFEEDVISPIRENAINQDNCQEVSDFTIWPETPQHS